MYQANTQLCDPSAQYDSAKAELESIVFDDPAYSKGITPSMLMQMDRQSESAVYKDFYSAGDNLKRFHSVREILTSRCGITSGQVAISKGRVIDIRNGCGYSKEEREDLEKKAGSVVYVWGW